LLRDILKKKAIFILIYSGVFIGKVLSS